MRAPLRVTRLFAVLLALAAAMSSCNSGKSNPTGPGGTPELSSGVLGPGATYVHQFAAAGSYSYHCTFHAPMRGVVTVAANAADSTVEVHIVSSTTTFPGALVRPGGTVTWKNDTQLDHTVTSD